ncbi:energy-coupling factor ABC transporter ATP-binding protein [Agilicoccus flavus]|uniref:energy-coupling factor ABC transporter ATP-binding protein n=1 Tax=Agilicoccus flavus TaxID=2775968 RepID=UPI001CF6606C|nr:ABC transporter ATP-binding protein [Agilicoccus flavus]
MITFDGVGHRFGDRTVLRGIDLDLRERFVGVVGANGSGKSTLARCVNGLVRPTSGRVVVDGLDVGRQTARVRRRVGFVFPDPAAQIVMPTPAEDVAFSLRRAGLSRSQTTARVEETLERFGLAGHADHPAGLLSSGQRQLLALASILVTEPDVLVCDEPTTLLDLRHTRRVAALLHGLPQQVLMVTHDLELLGGLERVIVVDEGRVVADGDGPAGVATYRALMEADAC